jgi:TolA-binding protein
MNPSEYFLPFRQQTTDRPSVHFCKGNLHYKHKRYEEAKTEYNVAKSLLIDDVKAPQHVRTGACLYKLGSIAIEQLRHDEAV